MTHAAHGLPDKGPEGSLFFPQISDAEHGREMFALLQGRGIYKGLDPDEQEEVARELDMRRNVTRRIIADRAIRS